MAQRDHDPIAKFIHCLDDAQRARIPNYEAMALATATLGGKTSVRFVLLKGIDERGFVFFTDARSRKGRELRGNPRASLAFYWQPRGRQVRVEGHVEEVTPAEADAYWSTRPRQSQLAASASHQSARLQSRTELLTRFAGLARKFKGRAILRPPVWIGFRVRPNTIEFWTHRAHRLHDREIYLRRGRDGNVICCSPRRSHNTGRRGFFDPLWIFPPQGAGEIGVFKPASRSIHLVVASAQGLYR